MAKDRNNNCGIAVCIPPLIFYLPPSPPPLSPLLVTLLIYSRSPQPATPSYKTCTVYNNKCTIINHTHLSLFLSIQVDQEGEKREEGEGERGSPISSKERERNTIPQAHLPLQFYPEASGGPTTVREDPLLS